MQSMGPAPGYLPAQPAKKKIHPLVWVLLVLVGLVVLGICALAAAGYYVARQFEKDPAGATVALLNTVDTGFEVVSVEKESGRLTLREKSSGKITTLNLNELKQSTFNVHNGGAEIMIADGDRKIVIGGGDTAAWIPRYEGVKVRRTVIASDGANGSQIFDTPDGASKVLDFYETEFSKAGMQVTRSSGTALAAKDNKRDVSVEVSMRGDGSRVILSYTAKD